MRKSRYKWEFSSLVSTLFNSSLPCVFMRRFKRKKTEYRPKGVVENRLRDYGDYGDSAFN